MNRYFSALFLIGVLSWMPQLLPAQTNDNFAEAVAFLERMTGEWEIDVANSKFPDGAAEITDSKIVTRPVPTGNGVDVHGTLTWKSNNGQEGSGETYSLFGARKDGTIYLMRLNQSGGVDRSHGLIEDGVVHLNVEELPEGVDSIEVMLEFDEEGNLRRTDRMSRADGMVQEVIILYRKS